MAFAVDRRRPSVKSSYMPYSTRNKKPSYFCDNCKILGHSIDRCFKLHGYPNKNKGKKIVGTVLHANISDNNVGKNSGLTNEQFSNILSFLQKQHSKQDSHIDESSDVECTANLAGKSFLVSGRNAIQWIVDSGATDHMCGNIHYFFNIKNVPTSKQEIIIPDGTKHTVTKMGDIRLTKKKKFKCFIHSFISF